MRTQRGWVVSLLPPQVVLAVLARGFSKRPSGHNQRNPSFQDAALMRLVQSERYEALEVVSSGGFGTVYKARDKALPRFVALKVLHGHLLADDVVMRRFTQEAEALTRLQSPYTCVVYDFGTLAGEDEQPYLAMEFVDGMSLEKALASGAMELPDAIPLMMEMCEGLEAAHKLGIIHRDIKPANIMLVKNEDGTRRVKIVDFGLAKSDQPEGLTRTGQTLGTPNYMSPEQCLGQQLDARSDVYALGCVFYEMLVGERLFDGDSTFELMNNQINSPARFRAGVDLPKWVKGMILRMVAKAPQERFATLAEVRDVLGSQTFRKPFRLSYRAVGMVAGAAMCAVAVGAIALTLKQQPIQQTQQVGTQTPAAAPRVERQQPAPAAVQPRDINAVDFYAKMPQRFDDAELEQIVAGNDQWRALHLSATHITDEGMKSLVKLTKLKQLYIGLTGVTDKGLMYVPPGVVTLGLGQSDTLNDPAVLQRLTQLEDLRFMDTLLNDAGMAVLGTKPSLRILNASRTRITDAGIKKLAGLPRLTELRLTQNNITDDSVDTFLQLPLQSLTIVRCRLTDRGLARLAAHKTLQTLNVTGQKITLEGLKPFATMPNLQRLGVDGVDIDIPTLQKWLPNTVRVENIAFGPPI